ncbi:glutathione S-transferase family protein [Methylobacterium haplocladii]|uniref:Glutathione S-transferase n=1 Tax=Methylobacterium haplocladii TaxID=1176176 RepID=A0A512IUE9_9HYPH|nr:glutathione S-transferase family protein [Methylobacterium haplocladii]GEP01333.1 glutathione S-transferase [Methylobacterium haplocladii]GJD83877.1 Disulfide-bond oxidoreductase YfcG [Methylobacterium haplocladii]GLS59964.1 glutathione S-transferase [Methylobacterium haplocladii]
MKLYYSEVLNPRKACAAAKYLNSPVDYVHVDIAEGGTSSPDFLAVNPNGKVPVLTDGELTLWESDAIICHLARAAGSPLWPKDDADKIEVLRWSSWNANHFTRATGALYFEHVIKPLFGIGAPDPKEIEPAMAEFHRFGRVLDDHLRGRSYLVGTDLSVADFAVAVSLPYAKQMKLPLDRFPQIARWHDRLNALPAWRDPFPSRLSSS